VDDYIEQGAVKVIEVIGVSDEGFEDAVRGAVRKAAESIRGITGVEVQSLSGKVTDGEIIQYRATVKLAFTVR
jgi:flavin-binding protein dodecin